MLLPVDPVLYAFFIGAIFILVLTPGPVVSLVIAETLNESARHGFAVVLGAASVAVVYLAIYTAGFGAVIGFFSDDILLAIRYAGAAYLIYLAAKSFMKSRDATGADSQPIARTPMKAFRASILVAATNPKAILFFAAFFPQFISPEMDTMPQLIMLAVTFAIVAPLLDCCWVLAASAAKRLLQKKGTMQLINRISGTILALGAVGLILLNT
ncbi:LysE family translocator [Kordiimonas gwangyangensis]|uniref:LysE family translocator n=1 Tax=Kordiimonas gwangyangensis TaxID=288022 RepID=UPI000369130B|nr:LysE family translocator [Kordiimonas gwangyangensis]